MSLLPIDRIPGVPDELLEQINDRLRRVPSVVGTGGGTAKVVKGKDGKPGPAGSPGAPGSGSVTPLAPELVDATATPEFSMWANVTAFTFDGQITVDDADPNWDKTLAIDVTAYGPTAPDGRQLAWLVWPFTVTAHKIDWSGDEGAFLQPLSGTESWTVKFTAYDIHGVPSATPIVVSGISIGPASVSSITAGELTPRFQDQNQGLLTRAQATIHLTDDQVPQNVTFWVSRDNGSTWLLQGWDKVTTSPATITLPFPNVVPPGLYVSSTGNETWKVAAASGPLTDATPPAEAVISTGFTVNQIEACNPLGVTSASSAAAVTFDDAMGIPDWYISLVQWTDPYIDAAHSSDPHYDINCWFTVLTFQCVDGSGNPAPAAQGGTEVEITRAPVLGHKVQSCTSINSFGFNPTGSAYHYARLRIYSVNRLSSTSFHDSTNAKLQTTCWSGADHLDVDFGSFPGASLTPSGFAPNLTGFTIAHTTGTEADYTTEGGLPKWSFHGTLTLPSPYTAIKRIHLTISGLPDEVLVIPSALFGVAPYGLSGLVMNFQTPTFPRDTVTFNYTVSAWVENSDGILTATPPTAALTVTGTAAPFSSSAPAAPTIATASAVAVWTPWGRTQRLSFDTRFTIPAAGAYSVRITIYNPDGIAAYNPDGTPIPSLTIPGPFLSGDVGTEIRFTTDVVGEMPSSSKQWKIRWLPINGDNVASTAKDVLVTVAPNVIASISGAEDTSRRFIEPGRGFKTWVNFVPTITSTNAPGFNPYQTLTLYLSYDGGTTWNWMGWQDYYSSGSTQSFEVWRPNDKTDLNCYAAAVIGAIDAPAGPISTATLNALGAVKQTFPGFTLARVTAPASNIVTGGFINARTGTTYNGGAVVLQVTSDGVSYWGLPDGLGAVNPPLTGSGSDPNWKYTALTCYCTDASGTPAPSNQGGVETIVGQYDQSGTFTCLTVSKWPFNTGSVYTYMRFRLWAVSGVAVDWKDSGYSTLQTSAWPGTGSYVAVNFGVAPASSITSTPTPAPAAPMVTSAIISPTYYQSAGDPWYYLTGTWGMPALSADCAKILSVRLYIPSLQAGPIFDFPRPSTGWIAGGAPSFQAGDRPQQLVSVSLPYEFRTVNNDGIETVPIPSGTGTGTVVVSAAAGKQIPRPTTLPITSVTISEIAARVRLADFTTRATIHVAVVLPADVGNQNYTAFYSDDGGSNFLWTNWYPIAGTSGSFDIYKVAPVTSKTIQVCLIPGTIAGDPTRFIARASLPGSPLSSCFSNTMTLAAISTAGTNVISSASLFSGVQYTTDPNGAQDWFIPDIVITDANPVTDAYGKTSRLKVFVCDASGNRASAADGGNDALVQQFDVDGTAHHCQTVSGWGFPSGLTGAGTTPDRARFFVEVVNAAGTATVQNCWGGAAFADAVFGAIPPGGIPAARIKTGTFGPGIISAPGTNQPTAGNPNSATSLLNDWDFALSYPNSLPSAAWAYSGVTITTGGINGGPYATIAGGFSFIQQKFACAPSQPLYFQLAARGHGSGTLALTCQFYNASGSLLGSVPVGSASGGVSWVATAISGIIAGSSVPSSATTARFTLQTSSGGSDIWDVTSLIARQVIQQTNNGTTDTLAGPQPGYNPASTTTTASGVYNSAFCQLVASDGSNASMQAGPTGNIQLSGAGGLQQIKMALSGGISTIIVVRGGASFGGIDTILQDNLGNNHTIKGGIIVS